MTYGHVAQVAGFPRTARQVGRVLASLGAGEELPWWRVVASGGRIALPGAAGERQRELLRAEGVEFGVDGRIVGRPVVQCVATEAASEEIGTWT